MVRALAGSLKRYSLPPEQYAALRARQVVEKKELGTADEIRIAGLERSSPEVLRALVESKPGEPLSEEKIGADLRRIYGRGGFERISYHLSGDAGPRAMVIEPREKSWGFAGNSGGSTSPAQAAAIDQMRTCSAVATLGLAAGHRAQAVFRGSPSDQA